MTQDLSTEVQVLLDQLRAGNETARDHLVTAVLERLRRLVRRMLHLKFPELCRWFETDDVWQEVSVRLRQALATTIPDTAQGFWRFTAVLIRNQCIDMLRVLLGPHGQAANQFTPPPAVGGQFTQLVEAASLSSDDPAHLMAWTEFHEAINALPEEDQVLFDLLWYQELTQEESAALLGVSRSTLKRRWQSARLRLSDRLRGSFPE